MKPKESQFKTVDSSAVENEVRHSLSGLLYGEYPTSETLRSDLAGSRTTGFTGPVKNNVRTRTPGESGPAGDFITPQRYNEVSTALTNMTASGEIAKLNSAAAARRKEKSTKPPIKISSDPAKGK